MQDPVCSPRFFPHFIGLADRGRQAIQEATASEPLSLEEEYENQRSWRASHDKLTFILCRPVEDDGPGPHGIKTGEEDSSDKMVGDINFFLYPWDEDDDGGRPASDGTETGRYCVGEVDIMIAEPSHRGQGLGKAAVLAFLHYIHRRLPSILAEYEKRGKEDTVPAATRTRLSLKQFMVKIKAANGASLALFKSLGFQQQGGVNYFGEVKLVLGDYEPLMSTPPEGYAELAYLRGSE